MKDANKNTVTDEMYPLRIQGAASRTGCADLARGKPQNCGLNYPGQSTMQTSGGGGCVAIPAMDQVTVQGRSGARPRKKAWGPAALTLSVVTHRRSPH